MLLMKESVLSFENTQPNLGLPTANYYYSFKTNPLKIILDDFSI